MLERWTLVTNGPRGENYYLRVSTTGQPENPDAITIANGGGAAQANEILDGGFLDLVRLGIREASDPRILSTLKAYEDPANGIAAPTRAALKGSFIAVTREMLTAPIMSEDTGRFSRANAVITPCSRETSIARPRSFTSLRKAPRPPG